MRRNKQTSGERIVKDIKRKTRKQYSAEEKIRIVLDGLRGEESVAELCRREGNGASYISEGLANYIRDNGMSHVRGAPYHPQTQGKIERWHQTLKNRILLENYFLPGDLEHQIESFVEHYNHHRYHESLNNVTPADVYFGRAQSIINNRERIKQKTIEHRRLQYRKAVA